MVSDTRPLLYKDSPPPSYRSIPHTSRRHLDGESNKPRPSRSRRWYLAWVGGCYFIFLPLVILATIFTLHYQGIPSSNDSIPEQSPPVPKAIAIVG